MKNLNGGSKEDHPVGDKIAKRIMALVSVICGAYGLGISPEDEILD